MIPNRLLKPLQRAVDAPTGQITRASKSICRDLCKLGLAIPLDEQGRAILLAEIHTGETAEVVFQRVGPDEIDVAEPLGETSYFITVAGRAAVKQLTTNH